MAVSEIDQLITLFARLPGLGPRSARRAVLHLLQRREQQLQPLAAALTRVAQSIKVCNQCGNLDDSDPCRICQSEERDRRVICVVEDVSALWALERSGAFRGLYHVLGGTLSALDGRSPEELNISGLISRARAPEVEEVILALGATVEGQTTAHYIQDRLPAGYLKVSRLAHGVPVGGALDYLDDGTLNAALQARRPA